MKEYSKFPDDRTRFEEITDATVPVAVFRQEPESLETLAQVTFHPGFDDLDYLRFALLDLSVGQVALVYHERSPQPGTALCIRPDNLDVPTTISEAIEILNIDPHSDINWIHPEYAKALILNRAVTR